jgi:CRISPR-associated protein Cmr3
VTSRTILIEPRDPLIFRDPRPAEAGLPIRSLDWPLPSAMIGAIRTRLGRLTGFDAVTVERLKRIEHVGPIPAIPSTSGWQLCFPAPADAVLFAGKSAEEKPGVDVCALRPRRLGENEGTNLDPELVPLSGAREEKPLKGPRFWTATATLSWLNSSFSETVLGKLGPGKFERQRRIHLEVDPATFAAKEGQLFSTEGLELTERVPEIGWPPETAALCSQIRTDDNAWAALDPIAPLGGERRLGYWSEPSIAWPTPPESLAAVKHLRLQLIAPAAFDGGWKPGWLNEKYEGSPPEFPSLKLRLVAAAVPRAVAHSGWDLTKRGSKGQKATRFLAPAGSVYFFESEQEVDARPLWLRSICDRPQDRLDGFGVVLCGGWKWLSD